jgi:hypothetical protein
MNQLTAKNGVAQELYRVGVKEAVDSTVDLLVHPTQYGRTNVNSLGSWYRGLNAVERAFANQLIRETAVMSVFGITVMLDGDAGPLEIDGEDAKAVLLLGRVSADTRADINEPTIPICPTLSGENLHDLFLDVVDANQPS